jgi:hypothetical protein
MPGRFPTAATPVDARDRAILERWTRARTTPQRIVLRSRMILLLADGCSAREAARRLAVSRHTVDLWRRRYTEAGCSALTTDRPGRGRKRHGISSPMATFVSAADGCPDIPRSSPRTTCEIALASGVRRTDLETGAPPVNIAEFSGQANFAASGTPMQAARLLGVMARNRRQTDDA